MVRWSPSAKMLRQELPWSWILGNGYQATYGQLKDIAVEPGQTVESRTILGYVSDPTKYYVKEGANLYFSMTKDGNPIDPMIYIETVTE